MSSSTAVFVDTWGWLSLGHRHDAHHERIKGFLAELLAAGTPIHTSDYVLDELISLLFRRENHGEAVRFVEGILSEASHGGVRIEKVTAGRFQAAWRLRKQYHDKPRISFTDLTSMVLMEELGIRRVVTEDEHFLHLGADFLRVP